MTAYSIQKDQPWIPKRVSLAPSASVYSNDDDEDDYDLPEAPAPPIVKALQGRQQPAYHAHPSQQIRDRGPQVRQSKLPIFKQVRSILHKPPPLTTPSDPKWDEYTGELSETGKPSKVKPSARVSPYDGAFKVNRKRSPDRLLGKQKRDPSPVSILRDEDLEGMSRSKSGKLRDRSPVSPVSDDDQHLIPEPLSPNIQRTTPAPQIVTEQSTPASSSKQIKRKPVSTISMVSSSSTTENDPPHPSSPPDSPSQSRHMADRDIADDALVDASGQHRQPNSHFSWTTYAGSVAPGRASIDTMATKHNLPAPENQHPKSRFSWSTVATTAARQDEDVFPSSPPLPPPHIPAQYATPPSVQSILSRRRPVQRVEREEWTPPPPRRRSRSETPKGSITPTSAHASTPLSTNPTLIIPKNRPIASSSANASPSTAKPLPPPPSAPTMSNSKPTHLENLLSQERDIHIQLANIRKYISELEIVEKSSPMDVPFSTIRSVQKRLTEQRIRLDEVKLEERENGVAIARARRREDLGDASPGSADAVLWVRRVTG